MMDLSLDRIFNIAENKLNELNFRRFQNGITKQCKLYHVSCIKNKAFTFDISLYGGKRDGSGQILAEMLPSVFSEFVDNQNKVFESKKRSDSSETNADIAESGEPKIVKLTGREQQIFVLSAKGLPIKIIADKLKLSERTVEKHRANIMGKAKAKNMIEAIDRLKKHIGLNQFNLMHN
jgi:two-component system alkaline phosphatase synthesis response regulator PhoP